jgi:isopentenyl-diphosphate delta-isomerase
VSVISDRKSEHLTLCAEREVEAARSTLLEEVQLLHDALPDLACDEIDSSVELLGRQLQAPILISGMTGGTEQAAEFNRALAGAAQKLGFGMGVGSQRAMQQQPELTDTFRVRDVAPDVLLLANLGAVQLRELGSEAALALAGAIGADAVCVHLNVAQELVQDEGDRDFRGCLAAIRELALAWPQRVVVKETGCGFAPAPLARLRSAGVGCVDVSGAGGTSWPGVESLRGSPRQNELGATLREWGIPTAPAVVYARRAGLRVIASGGVRGPIDVARALALGADVASLALPFLRAFAERGAAGVMEFGERLAEGVRAVMLLCGARDVASLARAPRVLGPRLRAWVDDPSARPSLPEQSPR